MSLRWSVFVIEIRHKGLDQGGMNGRALASESSTTNATREKAKQYYDPMA